MANSRSLVATSGVSMKIYKYSLLFPPLFLAGPAYLSGLPFQEMPMIFDCVYKHSGSQKAYWDPSVVMWQNTTGLSGHLPWGWETSKKSKQILAGLLSAAKAQLLGILSSNTKAYYYCVQIPPLPCLVPGVVALRLSRVFGSLFKWSPDWSSHHDLNLLSRNVLKPPLLMEPLLFLACYSSATTRKYRVER